MIRYFYGEDSFRIEKALEAEIVKHPGAEVKIFTPEGTSELQVIINDFQVQSFFAPERIFVLKNLQKLYKGKSKEDFLTAIKGLDKKTEVFLIEEKPLPKDFFKGIEHDATEFSVLKGMALTNFIKEQVKKSGGDIAPLAAERLGSYVGSDLTQLEEEIKKLVLYKKSDGQEPEPIQSGDVDLLVHANFDSNIFLLVDAIAGKNVKAAESLLNSFISAGENPLYLLSMIIRQFRNIAMFKFEKNLSEEAFARKTGQHPFVAKKTLTQSKNFTEYEVREVYQKLVWADLSLKSGSDPLPVLQRLIIL